MRQPTSTRARAAGFTMVELMTVLTIIVILITIIVPVVAKVRRAAQTAAVQQQMNELEAAIGRFYQDQNQYPGPLPNSVIYTSGRGATAPQIFMADGTTPLQNADKITQSENLLLGLLGGLKWKNPGVLCFDPTMIGRGMVSMNPAQPKRFEPYISFDPRMISTDQYSTFHYSDGAGTADDSPIPEILDKYPNPMPILYMRARVGTTGVVSDDVVAKDGTNYQYALSDIYPYTHGNGTTSIGEGKTVRGGDYTTPPSPGVFPHGLQTVNQAATLAKGTAGYQYPYDLFPYILNPSVLPTNAAQMNATGTPRSKDTYILIDAGPDRVYGTADDICSFGSVLP